MQGELFKLGSSGPVVEASRLSQPETTWLDRFRITLRLDHLSVVSILALVLYVLVFSFGVEKGKRMTLHEQETQKAKQEGLTKEVVLASVVEQDTLNKEGAPTTKELIPAVSSPEQKIKTSITGSGSTGRFTIQVATFNSKMRAEQEIKKLQEKGYHGFIIPGRKIYQVCVEMFEDVITAREKLAQLKSEGFLRRAWRNSNTPFHLEVDNLRTPGETLKK